MNSVKVARLKLIGVFMIFLLPLAGAYVLYYGLSYGSAGTNGGVLVSPARPLPDMVWERDNGEHVASLAVFEQDWTILQVAPEDCDQACRRSLKETRQIRALLHRRSTRVQRVLLVGAGQRPSFQAQPDLEVYRTRDMGPLLRVLRAEGRLAPGVVYLVDPLGNWMLYYPPAGDGEALFEDLKHLLKLSHIG